VGRPISAPLAVICNMLSKILLASLIVLVKKHLLQYHANFLTYNSNHYRKCKTVHSSIPCEGQVLSITFNLSQAIATCSESLCLKAKNCISRACSETLHREILKSGSQFRNLASHERAQNVQVSSVFLALPLTSGSTRQGHLPPKIPHTTSRSPGASPNPNDRPAPSS
jgi:hypothetical protein